jgi:hypothetical protein
MVEEAGEFGSFLPRTGGRPRPGLLIDDGAMRLASRRSLATTLTWLRTASRSSTAAKALSATTTTARPGSHLWIWRMVWRAQSVSVFGARGRSAQKRSEGARRVRNGRARMRPAHGTWTSSMADSQRSPLVFTKCPLEERIGSR